MLSKEFEQKLKADLVYLESLSEYAFKVMELIFDVKYTLIDISTNAEETIIIDEPSNYEEILRYVLPVIQDDPFYILKRYQRGEIRGNPLTAVSAMMLAQDKFNLSSVLFPYNVGNKGKFRKVLLNDLYQYNKDLCYLCDENMDKFLEFPLIKDYFPFIKLDDEYYLIFTYYSKWQLR